MPHGVVSVISRPAKYKLPWVTKLLATAATLPSQSTMGAPDAPWSSTKRSLLRSSISHISKRPDPGPHLPGPDDTKSRFGRTDNWRKGLVFDVSPLFWSGSVANIAGALWPNGTPLNAGC